jgi:SpoVK/Ycf46/Vps4 family AAA+-type ATPase
MSDFTLQNLRHSTPPPGPESIERDGRRYVREWPTALVQPKVPYIERDGQRYLLDESGSNKESNFLRFMNLEPPLKSPEYKIAEKETPPKRAVKKPKVEELPEPEEEDASLPPSFLKLNKMTGLQAVKDAMREVIALVKLKEARANLGLPDVGSTLHLVFTGNPGTGKTVVARLIADIYRELGVLSKGHLVEVSRQDLVGKYIGQTAPKVQKAVDKAMGGVLFIDEAYSLFKEGESSNDFGKEAIDSLVPLMENHRDSFALIVAGYKREMDTFLEGNPGLKSRFAGTLHFEDYSFKELFSIFQSFCAPMGLVLDEAAELKVREHISEVQKQSGSDFGNGRAMRNLLDQCIKRQARRLSRSKNWTRSALQTLTEADIPKEVKP